MNDDYQMFCEDMFDLSTKDWQGFRKVDVSKFLLFKFWNLFN